MENNSLLKISIQHHTKKEVLEQIIKSTEKKDSFFHIVSLNGENMTIANRQDAFFNVLSESSIKIIDGASVALACSILNIAYGERIAGVDLMHKLLLISNERGLRVLFLGGRADLAERMAECYKQKYPKGMYRGVQGIRDISAPQQAEYDEISAEVLSFKPDIVFAAFGSPFQELFFYRHRASFGKCVCMGVGGSYDFALSDVPRAPLWMRSIGLEWLFRLAIQPWRFKRQLRLFIFMYLVIKQKLRLFPS